MDKEHKKETTPLHHREGQGGGSTQEIEKYFNK